MHILDQADLKSIQVLINELIISVDIRSKENIAIKFLDYLRKNLVNIEDWKLYNELCILIEEKLNEGRHHATITGNSNT
ncbi:MAG: hypothetical protein APF81_14580 [Desulfosporosinus sp. BRH_c37]|nr:MAG: hypothetical protein APF81_14580 [Desulfosporosinus sp. BRH_c37]